MARIQVRALRSAFVAIAVGGVIAAGGGTASAYTNYYDSLNFGRDDGNYGVLREDGVDCNWANDYFSNSEVVNNDITSIDSWDSRGDYLFNGTQESGCTSASYSGWDLYVAPYATITNLNNYGFNNLAGGHIYS
ncbi:hypothetical protein ACFRI7_05335 [Streptomyces sp. NPDC056716]|uniref:hypothetical protein n=1 Tax=unclassified Streptomyces TaxID=2593676 RepID=UPI0036CBD8F4